MSDHDNDNIAEDVPEMRSVALHPAGVPMPLARASPLQRSKPSPAMYEPQLRSSAASSKSSEPARSTVWDVSVAPSFPPMYFLERTHVYVADTPVKEVASRIVDCLRSQSIATNYHSDEAMVEAETPKHVQFAVRLWKDQSQVVVEVQKAAGCCFLFHQASKAVLRASKGLSTRSTSPPPMKLPDCVPQETEQQRKDCLTEGIEIASSLLKQDKVDGHLMALESLRHLTKVCKCQGYAADCILKDSDILDAIMSLIISSCLPGQSSMMQVQDDYSSRMHQEALAVLASCLVSLKTNGKLQQTLHNLSESLLSDSLIVSLIEQIAGADEQPHQACHAVNCLRCLMDASLATRRRAKELGLDAAISTAHQQGQCSHVQLEKCCDEMRLSLSA